MREASLVRGIWGYIFWWATQLVPGYTFIKEDTMEEVMMVCVPNLCLHRHPTTASLLYNVN